MKDIIQLAEEVVEQYGKDAHCTGYAQAEDCPVRQMALDLARLRHENQRLRYLTRGEGEYVESAEPLRLMTRDGMEDAK